MVSFTGWTVDTAAEGWSGIDDVQIFLGQMDSGTLVGRATLGFNRTDVAAATGNQFWSTAGWSASVDTGALHSGDNPLFVYAHTPSKGWWFTQLTVSLGAPSLLEGAPPTVNVSAPRPNEHISIRLGTYSITGPGGRRVRAILQPKNVPSLNLRKG